VFHVLNRGVGRRALFSAPMRGPRPALNQLSTTCYNSALILARCGSTALVAALPPGNGGRNNFPVSVGTGGMPRASPVHIAGSEAKLRGSLACVTTLLASVGRCSRPERIRQEILCFATTLLASVERCSRRSTP
jgi:hypothetical protein